jgi:hypothetical protein
MGRNLQEWVRASFCCLRSQQLTLYFLLFSIEPPRLVSWSELFNRRDAHGGIADSSQVAQPRSKLDDAPSVFDRGPDGELALLTAPTRQALGNDPAPDSSGTHIHLTSASNSQPPTPLENQEQTHSSQDQLDFQTRFAGLDENMKAFINFNGGTPLKNKELVLARLEEWNAEKRGQLIQVERKGEKRRGVVRVICGLCEQECKNIQKAAEHITSTHWKLDIWECDIVPWCVCYASRLFGLSLMLPQ